MCVVVCHVGAGGEDVHLFDLHVVFSHPDRLRSTIGRLHLRSERHFDGVDRQLVARNFGDRSLAVEQALALLHAPLELTREQSLIVVRLQRVATSEDVHDDLCRGQPVAAVGHGSQADGEATSSGLELLLGPALLGRDLPRVGRGTRLLSRLGFFPLLLLQAMNPAGHRLEEKRRGLHHLALIFGDVEVHLVRLAEGRREHVQRFLVDRGEVDAVEPLQTCWSRWTAWASLEEVLVRPGLPAEPDPFGGSLSNMRIIVLAAVFGWSNGLRSTVRTIVPRKLLWGRADQHLEFHVAPICHLADVIGSAAQRLIPSELAAKLLVSIVRSLHIRRGDKRHPSSPNALAADLLHSEVPEATRRYLVGAKALLGFKLLLNVIDTGLRTAVLVVGAVVVEGVPAEVCCPGISVASEDVVVRLSSIGAENALDLAALTKAKELRVASVRWVTGGGLSSTTQRVEAEPLAVKGEAGLEGARER